MLVDVREPNEIAAESYPDAVLMPLSQFDPAALPDPAGKQVVFACGSGKRSMTASLAAQEAGLPYRRASRRRACAPGRMPDCRPGAEGIEPMRRLFWFVFILAALDRGHGSACRANEKRAHRQYLQLVGLHRSGGDRGLHQNDRHQGALRHVRFQRHAGNEAADRKIRLRRGRADRVFPRTADQGRRVPEARQRQADEYRKCLAGDRSAAVDLRSRQSLRGQLHVGDDGDRIQRQEDARHSRRRHENR